MVQVATVFIYFLSKFHLSVHSFSYEKHTLLTSVLSPLLESQLVHKQNKSLLLYKAYDMLKFCIWKTYTIFFNNKRK